MRKKYLFFFLVFLLLAGVFTLFRTTIADFFNVCLIAVKEGRSIRVDNSDLIRRPKNTQVKVKGAGGMAGAAQVKVMKENVTAFPVSSLVSDASKKKTRKELFITNWAVLGPFDLSLISKDFELKTVLDQECMNESFTEVSTTLVPKDFAWQNVEGLISDGRINVSEIYRKNKNAAAMWAVADVTVSEDIPDAVLLACTQQISRIFVNGKPVFVSFPKMPIRVDGIQVTVPLKKGTNRIFIKLASQNARNWYFYLRFTDAKKVPLIPAPPQPGK